GGGLEALAQAWEIALPNKEALRQLTRADTPVLSEGYRQDHARFTREFARRYFAVCAAAIRKYDTHHLILGCRFAGLPDAAVLAECVHPQVDVLSVDAGSGLPEAPTDEFGRAGAMPVLLGEFSWTGESLTRRAATGEWRGLTSVERMLARGRAGLQRAMAHPAVVGYAWPRWADTADDQPPFGGGLVHVDDREAREHTELLADLNARAAALRLAAVPRFPRP
ncbi:MAG: hypothetical protein ABUL68_05525, partial [Pseudomonadota bacterium]